MTGVDDELARARRALRTVPDELDLTWGDVLARVEDGDGRERETAPVVPLGGAPAVRRAPRRLAVAAALVVALGTLGAGAGVAAQRSLVERPASTAPAATAATPGPADPAGAEPGAVSDEAQAVVDRARDALGATAWCGVGLASAAQPRTVLRLDAGLEPALLASAEGLRGRTADGTEVAVDDATGTWWALTSADDVLTDRPDLRTAVHALRRFLDGKGEWQPAGDGSAVTDVVDGTVVVLTVDERTGLLAGLAPRSAGDALTLTWLPCDDTTADSLVVTVPSGYASAPARAAGAG